MSTQNQLQKLSTRDEARIQLALSRARLAIMSVVTSSFIWRPGGVAGGNVYTSWATLYPALVAAGGTRFVWCDPSLDPTGLHITAAASSYVIDGLQFFAAAQPQASEPVVVTIDDGASIAPGIIEATGIEFTSVSTAPVQQVLIGSKVAAWILRNGSSMRASAAAPFISTSQPTAYILLYEGSSIGDGTHPVIDGTAPGSGQVRAFDGSSIQNLSIASSAAGNVTLVVDDTVTLGVLPLTVPTTLASQAGLVAYAPSVPGDWPGTPPTEVAGALDELATRLIQTESATAAGPVAINNAGFTEVFAAPAIDVPVGAQAIILVTVEYDAGPGNGTDQRVTQEIRDAANNVLDTCNQDISSSTDVVVSRVIRIAPAAPGSNTFSVWAQDSLATNPAITANRASIVVLSVGV
jgi:hypothetical protein